MADAGMPWHLHLQLSQDLRKGYAVMRGALVPVAYQVVDGHAIFEGDIVLGSVADVDWLTDQATKGGGTSKELIARLGNGLWPKATVPYVIERSPKAHLIAEATRIWSEQTAI
jgi:hypothetical protein